MVEALRSIGGFGRDVFSAIVLSIALLLGVEIAIRVVEKAAHVLRPPPKEGMDRDAIAQLGAAFGGNYKEAELLRMQGLVRDALRYQPWVQIGNNDHANDYSVVENGVRKTKASEACANPAAPRTRVWFFGGSTTYGVGVPWWDTIPSYFVEHATRRQGCLVATNFGVPYHFSRQQAVHLSSMLMREPAPDIVVFLDGLNDFGQPGSSIRAEPFFTPTLDMMVPAGATSMRVSSGEQLVVGKLGALAEHSRILKFLQTRVTGKPAASRNEEKYSNREVPAELADKSPAAVARAIVDNYMRTRVFLEAMCEAHRIRCFQFLQPVAVKDYDALPGEKLTSEFRDGDPQRVARFLEGYRLITDKLAGSGSGRPAPGGSRGDGAGNGAHGSLAWADISASLKGFSGIPYIDTGHYSPDANRLLARQMADIVFR